MSGKGCFWPSLYLSSGGVSDLQHFGMRLGSSELSFLLKALGYLSPEDPASGAISSLGVGYLLVLGKLMLAMRKSLRGRLHAGLLWEGGLCLAHGVPGRVCLPWGEGDCVSSGYLSGEGGRVSLVCWGVGFGEGGVGARRVPTLGSCFSWFVPLPTASLLPGRAPAPPPLPPTPPHPWRCEHNPVDL